MSLQVVPVSRVPWLPAGVGSWDLTQLDMSWGNHYRAPLAWLILVCV